MTAHARYVDHGHYEPIHDAKIMHRGRVEVIAQTLARPATTQIGYSRVMVTSDSGFDAESNLNEVLQGVRERLPSNEQSLIAARAALARMSEKTEQTTEWVFSLAADISTLRD